MQGSTTEYVPVYTPNYYKVADGVKAFYLNDIHGKETLEGIKNFVANSSKKDWKPGKSFVGNLDGNGVTIYGMYSSTVVIQKVRVTLHCLPLCLVLILTIQPSTP